MQKLLDRWPSGPARRDRSKTSNGDPAFTASRGAFHLGESFPSRDS